MPRRQEDWRHRDGAALAHARRVRELAQRVSEDLLDLAHCRVERGELAGSISALRSAIADAEALATHFDCHDLHTRDAQRLESDA